MEYISINPLGKIGNFKRTVEVKKEMQFYTSEEFLKFIKPARKLAKQEQYKIVDFMYSS